VARTPFRVEVLTPEGEVFNDEVEMLSTRTGVGSIGVLANHSPLLALLEPTELRLHRSEGDIVAFAQAEGYLQVGGNHALVLVQEAVPADQLDRAALQERVREADETLQRGEQETEEWRTAERSKRRAEAFLAMGEGH